jgi:hypothetical protein
MKRTVLCGALFLAVLAAPVVCESQALTWDQVLGFDWSGPIQMGLKAATDGVFEGGPDYCYASSNEWLSESDVVYQLTDFAVQIYNNRSQDVDDLIFLVAYDSGTFFSLKIGEMIASPAGFCRSDQYPFGPGGGRPGDGEAALYNAATGVIFVQTGFSLPAHETVEIPMSIIGAEVGTRVHLDFYGVVGTKVVTSCAASNDVTWQNTCAASPTQKETWGATKAAFRR